MRIKVSFPLLVSRAIPPPRAVDNSKRLKPSESNIVVVKIGYLVPELYDINKGWIMALTPGGVDQDLFRLDYKRIKRPMFPIDSFTKDPELKAVFVPLSN